MTHTQRFYLAVAAISILFVHSQAWAQGLPTTEPSRAQIAFAAVTSDASIKDVMTGQPLLVTAVFTWAAGITGTYRNPVPLTPPTAISEARRQMIAMYANGLQSNITRLQAFIQKNTIRDVTEGAQLETQARSLLGIRRKLELALQSAQQSDPIIYGLEVSGSLPQVQALTTSPEIRAFYMTNGGPARRPEALKPALYRAEFRDPTVQAMTAEQVYRAIEDVARNSEGR